MSAVIGLDVGTTAAKAALFAPDGTALATAGREYPLAEPAPGWSEQDPDQVVGAALDTVREVAAGRPAPACLALSAPMHGLVPLDGAGRPLGPLLTWADHRAGAQAAALRADPAAPELRARCGTPLHPTSPLAKIRWFREEDQHTFAAARTWVGLKELLIRALTGQLAVDASVASATGLYDVVAGGWSPLALGLAGIGADRLAPLVPVRQVLPLTREAAARTGLPAGLPVVVGGCDGALANLAVGVLGPGVAGASIGTSAALRSTVGAPAPDPDGHLFCYVLDEAHWVVGGATNSGGNVLRWVHRALAPDLPDDTADATLAELAGTVPPGADGLLMLPYLAGERAPRWADGAAGAYVGLTGRHGRAHLVRAALEGVCLQLALVLRAMRAAGHQVDAVRATGGFARSPVWRQLLCDVLGVPVAFPMAQDGTAYGAALLGRTAVGLAAGLDDRPPAVDGAPPATPDPAAAARYAELLPVFDDAWTALAPTWARLAPTAAHPPAHRAG